MAHVDARTILSDKQVIKGKTLSQKAIAYVDNGDQAFESEFYIGCYIQGDFTHDLRVQILGFNDETFGGDPVLIGDSGVIEKENLTFGTAFSIKANPTGKRYKYLALRYIPTLDGVEVTDDTTDSPLNPATFAIPTKIVDDTTPVADAIRAQYEREFNGGVSYPFANQDKITG